MKKNLLLFTILFTCGSSIFAQVPSYVPTNGLVGWWPFNGNAIDENVSSYDGSVSGATLSIDRFSNLDKAYSFDGVDDIITLNGTSGLDFNTGIGVSFWMNITSLPATGESIIFSQQTSSSTSAIGFNISITSGGKLNFRLGNGSAATYSGALNNSVNMNQWIHVVCQFQNGMHEVYFDSQLVNSTSSPNAIIGLPSVEMVIGDDTWAGTTAYNFNGIVDDIAIWNRALSSCEIADLYNSQLGSMNSSATQTQISLDSYTWPINNQTYTQSGTYTAVIPNAAGCDSTITLDLTLSFTGVDEQGKSKIIISPNPASDYFIISASEELIGEVYSIIDLNGKTLKKGTLTQKEQKIEIGNLSEGMYLFKINNISEQTFRIIKN